MYGENKVTLFSTHHNKITNVPIGGEKLEQGKSFVIQKTQQPKDFPFMESLRL